MLKTKSYIQYSSGFAFALGGYYNNIKERTLKQMVSGIIKAIAKLETL